MKMSKTRKILVILLDIMCLVLSYSIIKLIESAFTDRNSFGSIYYLYGLLTFIAAMFLARFGFGVYSNIWRFANSNTYIAIVLADMAGGVLSMLALFFFNIEKDYFSLLYLGIGTAALFDISTLSARFIYQITYRSTTLKKNNINKIGVAIVGAGKVGVLLAEELMYNKNSHYEPLVFIDNDKSKIGNKVIGLKVYDQENAIQMLKTTPVKEIFIAIPNLSNEMAKKLHEVFSKTGCKVKIYDFPIKGDDSSFKDEKRVLREIKIEDLLFRDSLNLSNNKTADFYENKTVLVTGGGGSIGSELCRQIAKCGPRKLIILDIYENNAYEIQQELMQTYKDSVDLCVEIASVRDKLRLDDVFKKHRPDIVFHAAAHKHVPLMEHSGTEAVKNNIFGTYNTVLAAEMYGVKKFIMISTDKAVNPTNIMGASKRVCEMIIQSRYNSGTSFSAVRFGNVLGSNGSVIPLFKKQIENGGPITVTDKRIIRYFMTIPEASQLVMEAGAMAKSGELYVLDMGKPVKIIDLAENIIKLSGYKPYEDIDIVEIGLRPGEKLYEELLIKTEKLSKTDNKMIFIEKDTALTKEEIEEKLKILEKAVDDSELNGDPDAVRRALQRVVPTYHNPDDVNKTAVASAEMLMTLNKGGAGKSETEAVLVTAGK